MLHPSLRLGLAGVFLLVAFSGCESTRTLRIARENPTGFSYDADGTVVLRSEKTHRVAVRITRERGTIDTASLPALSIYVTNGGKNSMSIGPEDITATTGENEPVPVLGRADTAVRLRREEKSISSGTYASTTSPSSSSLGMGGRDASSGGEGGFPRVMSNNTPVYNNDPYPTAGSSSSSDSSRGTTFRSSSPEANLDRFLAPLMVRTPIPPGQTAGGTVKIDIAHVNPGAPVRLTVEVAGEQHEFLFTVQ